MMPFYDDGVIQLDRAALTLRRYHFPSGTSKVIALDRIRGYKAEPLGLFLVRFNLWGSPTCGVGFRWTCTDPSNRRWSPSTYPASARNPPAPRPVRTTSPHCWTNS